MMKFLYMMLLSFSLFANDDPWEGVNRGVFEFNQVVDENIITPVAEAYKNTIPKSAQNRVSDFSGNLGDVSTFGNELLQFKLLDSVNTFGRVLINSTLGVFGLFDIASEMGLKKTKEDFGQTMAVWGVPKGQYVVLPILGPSTLRDALGIYVDTNENVEATQKLNNDEELAVSVIRGVDTRVKLFPATDIMNDPKQTIDPYTAARSAYLQKREFDVFDGNVPIEDDDF